MMKWAGRASLRAWARSGKAPGYHYEAVERWGSRLARRPLTAVLPDGSLVECNLRESVQRHIYFHGAYEPIESFLFTRLIRPGAVVVDAGANVGQFTLLAASFAGPTGAVHSFEPVPSNFRRVWENVERNAAATARVNQLALWNEPATLELGRPPTAEADNDGTFAVGVTGGVVASGIRFDDYAREHGVGRVDVVKMDIEGAEWPALRGMNDALERYRPVLLLEVNRVTCQRAGYDPQVFWDMLCGGLGYTAWRIGLSAREWARLASPPHTKQTNVLFTPGKLPKTVASGWDFRSCLRWARSGRFAR